MKPTKRKQGEKRMKAWIAVDKYDGEILECYIKKPNPKYDSYWEDSSMDIIIK